MLSSLLRPKNGRRVLEQPLSPSPLGDAVRSSNPGIQSARVRHATADWTETEDNDEDTEEEDLEEAADEDEEDDEDDEDDGETSPLLPIFSAAHLDALPVYNLTHAIRLIVLPRCETTLTYDQLRSPQVSQFLVKPMQQQIRTSHFSRATLYALMANCLQFGKEAQMNPGNAGNSRTRAMVCELLAIKLLKEYNTRELIDALSYDFFPLQGLVVGPGVTAEGDSWEQRSRPKPVAARISTLEVAIRAQAKRFLAHPLVVQQLEAVWAGTIVFHSAADHLHRQKPRLSPQQTGGSGSRERRHLLRASPDKSQQTRPQIVASQAQSPSRRTVTLYDPRDASLFKLSRLRVPRYRQFFSTCSLAVLLGLFLAVLIQRSIDITTLEVVFWLWSAGFMLDEIVGFNEQGFSLYIMSFWNTFDLGILLLLIIFYCMRLYGIFLVDVGKHQWNDMAYDVLAANAVLLFPRLFSVLDHYRYFSQLLIAFRLMAVDLAAVFILIIISCSGFFVAFTLSFGKNEYDAAGVAYGLFQMLMGFTPAAWEAWPTYNILGKAILTLFLFICHFLIVTILITVLTNSFMAIVSNANEEHQFVFAVNTISMVKNDALFSYVAPSNLLAWILTPSRYLMPFRQFVKLNRYVIKTTHFPLLFAIFAYEKLFLARSVYEPTDLIENRGRRQHRAVSFLDPTNRTGLFSPSLRVRQDSVAGFQKDRALEEVFRLGPGDNPQSIKKSQERRQTSSVVNNWMDQHEGIASPPSEQDRSIVDRLERKRQASQRANMMRQGYLSRQYSGTKSAVSDPTDVMSVDIAGYRHSGLRHSETDLPTIFPNEGMAHTDDEGDDELVTNEEEEVLTKASRDTRSNVQADLNADREVAEDYFNVSVTARPGPPFFSSSAASSRIHHLPPRLHPNSPPNQKHNRRQHDRTLSTNTILYNPVQITSKLTATPSQSRPLSTRHTPTRTGAQTPAKRVVHASKARPIMLSRAQFQSAPDRAALFNSDSRMYPRQIRHRRSSLDMGLDFTSGTGLQDINLAGVVPSSFATQMAMATGMVNNAGRVEGHSDRLMGRLMLARMKTLEEGFQEVVREFKEMRTSTQGNNSPVDAGLWRAMSGKERDKGKGVARRSRRSKSRPKIRAGVEDEDTEMGWKAAQTPEDKILAAYTKKGSSF